jgi:hypothetical protein
VRAPHSSVIGLFGEAKVEIHTLSLPSMVAAQGPGRPPAVNGDPGKWLPSGRRRLTLPPSRLPLCFDIGRVSFSSMLPPSFEVTTMSTTTAAPRSELPRRFVTHTFPWLSIARPLPLHPLVNFSALLGSDAGKRVTCSPTALVTQIRFCWSMGKWNGASIDLQGSTSKPSQTILP